MANWNVWGLGALTLLGITAGCGNGGGSGDARKNQSPNGVLPSVLTIRTQWPEAGNRHIPVAARVAIQFDAPVHPQSILDGLTFLEERDTGTRIPARISLDEGDTVVALQPTADLAPQTWYTCHLSPLLCDRDERLLEEDQAFSFQTVDVVAPRILAASIPEGAIAVSKSTAVTVDFDESIDPDSVSADTVRLLDADGSGHDLDLRATGSLLRIVPVGDLRPEQTYTLQIDGQASGVRDLAGNGLTQPFQRSFTTGEEVAPRVVRIDPDGTVVSPKAQIFVHLDSSVAANGSGTGITFRDSLGDPVPFTLHASADRRTLRLAPTSVLLRGSRYTVAVTAGSALATPSGLPLGNSRTVSFDVGADATAPSLVKVSPANEAMRISVQVHPTFEFDEQLDALRANETNIEFADEKGSIPFVLTPSPNHARIVLTPTTPLEAGKRYTVTFRGGPFGNRDMAGNPLTEDLVTSFHTTTDATPPTMVISPTHGHSAVSRRSTFTAAFTEPLDPLSVGPTSVIVTDELQTVVAGTLTLSGENRILTFTPSQDYTPGMWISVLLRDGIDGIREQSGNWLEAPVRTSFRIAQGIDTTPPDVWVTVNSIADLRKQSLAVPRSGFEITVGVDDPVNFDVDLGSFVVEITGPSTPIANPQILANGQITKGGLRFVVPENQAFLPGVYTLRARADDMAGNEGLSEPLQFTVVEGNASMMPFERTQVVFVRFDLDRDRSGRPDFIDDLYRLGLVTEGDPAGTNQRMIDIMREGILSRTHQIFQRKTNGGRRDQSSMPVLFTATQPRGVKYAEMAFGGLDPSAPAGRVYSDPSSGILGRAYYDDRNSSRSDQNTSTSPGLGVFGGELFLFEVETHLSLYPTFLTSFAHRFQKVIPAMGGTTAGAHQLDRTVLMPGFEPDQADLPAKRRFYDVFLAADDWAAAMSVVLAHETGHTVGLVATGEGPSGLHGDGSLHNRNPNLGDVMSSAVGYESLVNLQYRFRDLNAAYLRQRVLLK